MSYQVIARKFRPQSFADLVGQPHISQTLTNALKHDRLHHALLFTGPRGTGKTSSARILAKSIRCPNSVDFVPCNVCSECEEVSSGRSVNVMEIDGASNNGVDAIRDLRDSVGFMPATGRYKIYIIDEVHMLSTSAFNALLKTLEEPPSHVIFIMATTEVHKIPQTILSRCQRFDFRRISTREITECLKNICSKENVRAENDALWLIARQGDGSMRDSQSLLDQVITFTGSDLTLAKVVEVLGLTDRTLLLETLTALISQDLESCIRILEKLSFAGVEPHLFSQDLLEVIRNLLLIKISGNQTTPIVELPDSEIAQLKELAQTISEEDIHLLFDMTLKGGNDIPRAQDPRLVLEMLLLRLVHSPRVMDLMKALRTGNLTATAAHPSLATPAQKKSPESFIIDPKLPNEERWLALTQKIKNSEGLLGAKIENLLLLGVSEQKEISLGIPAKLQFLKDLMNDKNVLIKMQSYVDQYWGTGYAIQVQQNVEPNQGGLSAQGLAQQKEEQRQTEIKQQVSEHPLVQSAQSVFKGQIKNIKETP